MTVVGPNGLGYVNVPRSLSLMMSSGYDRRAGSISVVSYSGGMLLGVSRAVWAYDGVGITLIVSVGNEAVTHLADYVDFLAGDPATTSIGLIIDKTRNWPATNTPFVVSSGMATHST